MLHMLLATGNSHKVQEIQTILGGAPIRVAPPEWHFDEGLESLLANAAGKAESAREFANPGEIVLAEDTGLFVPALKGEPGVASARYAGENVNFDQNIEKLLKNMAGLRPQMRRAAFLTVAAAIFPDGRLVVSCGRLDGAILETRRGFQGFGYDPIFLVPETGKTLAELSAPEKNKISHRGRALRSLLPYFSL